MSRSHESITGFAPQTEAEFGALLREAQAGQSQAVHRILESCRDYLLLIANQELDPALRAKVGASDIVQETMLTAHQSLSDFRGGSHGELRGWLRAILRHDLLQVRRHYRATEKRRIGRELPLPVSGDEGFGRGELCDPGATPGSEAMAREEEDLLQDALARIPEEYQQVVQLRNWQHLSFDAIGEKLNRTSDAARKLWYRAIIRLQQELAGHGHARG